MTVLISLSIALITGLILAKLVKPLKLPSVTAYLVAGILVGPFGIGRFGIEGIGFINEEAVKSMSLISDVALGFIAFSIGNEFKIENLKKTGRQATIIGIAQALVTTVCVDTALLVASKFNLISYAQAITLGAIATATAPAATLMVVRQYHAQGETVNLLLPIVALDDAVGLMVFAVSFGIARAINSGVMDIYSIIVNPVLEIVCSLGIGALLGFVLSQNESLLYEKFHEKNQRVSVLIAFVFLAVGLSKMEFEFGQISIGFSSLLVCMMLGTVFCNMHEDAEYLMDKTDNWTTALLAIFFVISGSELDMGVFASKVTVILGIVYIATRCLGKYFGTFISAKATGVNEKSCKYLGITLFPQAGVALGMCVTARSLGEEGILIANITLMAILIYELFGPMLTKLALTKAGDIED